MDFDDLRNYVVGDDIKDIDWKSSARSGDILVRRYVAEKKHNILLVLDTGKKMLADTKTNESKKEVALMSAGILAYIAYKHGDYIGAIYKKNDSIEYNPFKYGLYNIEKILSNYDKAMENNEILGVDNILDYVSTHIKRRMIIFVVTDIEGLESIQDETLKKISMLHDIMFVNISDAYMTGDNVYDIDKSHYLPELILKDTKLHELEKQVKEEIYKTCLEKLKKYKTSIITIDDQKEIIMKVIELLERHRYTNVR